MSKELELSMSFRMGFGCIEHNLRIKKGQGPRQNGIQERRFLNEHIVVDEQLLNEDKEHYVDNLLHKVVEEKIAEQLYKINEKHIRQRHPKKVRTVDDWIRSQQYVRGGNQKKILCEYVVQLGNKYTGCPFEMQLDKDGNILDKQGNKIKEWDTRKTPGYKDGIITESKRAKLIKKIYREFVNEFQKANPQATVLCASIHSDEYGGCHLHLTVLWWSKKQNDVGYGLSYSSALEQQFDAKGIKYNHKRYDNATTLWKTNMRVLLKQIALKHNVVRLNMHNKEKHRETDGFKKYKDAFCYEQQLEFEQKESELKAKENELKELEQKLKLLQNELTEKENELSKDIAKQEWYLLKKFYPEWYSEIHSVYLKNKNNNRKSIKNKNNSLYKGDSM